jgi:hypothetical protein
MRNVSSFNILAAGIALTLLLTTCDNRGNPAKPKDEASFSANVTIIRDLSQRKNLAQVSFFRNNQSCSTAVVKINGTSIPSTGNGAYFGESPLFSLNTGGNQIAFSNTPDSYSQEFGFDLPDSFGVTGVNPRFNPGAQDVQLGWSNSSFATKYLLVVVSQEYPGDNTSPLMLILNSSVHNFVIPDTTFENDSGSIVPGTYYIYLAAFNQGFGEYRDIKFPLPQGLPRRIINNPSGFLRYGTVARADSIIV